LAMHTFEQFVAGLLFHHQARGILLNRMNVANTDKGAGKQKQDDQGESGDENHQQTAVSDLPAVCG